MIERKVLKTFQESNCTECNSVNIERENYTEEVNIRGETFKIDTIRWHCKDCGIYWRNLGEDDYMKKAFQNYQEKYNMVQPEKIKELRKKYGLTQSELASIFDWGVRTLSRYETGGIQKKGHDSLLKLLENPKNFYNFINNKIGLENKEKFLENIKKVEQGIDLPSVEEELEPILNYPASEYTGFLPPSMEKIINVIYFFCIEDDIFSTKLNKFLFYTDFIHFKEYVTTLMGLRYRKFEYGPVPDEYYKIIAALIKTNKLQAKETKTGDYVGTVYKALVKPDLSVFSTEELETLVKVKKKFKGWGSGKISDFSHEEEAWKKNEENDLISYEYAMKLNV